MATTFINANRTSPSGERTLFTGQLTHVVTMVDLSTLRHHSCCLSRGGPDRCHLLDCALSKSSKLVSHWRQHALVAAYNLECHIDDHSDAAFPTSSCYCRSWHYFHVNDWDSCCLRRKCYDLLSLGIWKDVDGSSPEIVEGIFGVVVRQVSSRSAQSCIF